MSATARMHADELDIDAELVRRLVAEQFPEWAELAVTRVASAGTDNAMYRLGEDMVVRLPRLPGGARQIETEQRWLPRLAPHLPLAELGRFVAALRRVDAVGGPVSFRGRPLGPQDADVRKAIEDLGADGTHDPTLATAAWEHALGVGDPAADAVWARGRGWALCFGLVAEHYYRGGRNPVLAGVGHRAVREVLEEFGA